MKNTSLKSLLLLFICTTFLTSCSEDELDDNVTAKKTTETNVLKLEEIGKELDAKLIISEEVTPENAIIIESEEELRKFIIEIKEQAENTKNIIAKPNIDGFVQKSCADGVYRASGLTSGFATLGFDVSVSDGCISGISGSFTGWTLGASYSQGGTSFGCNSGTVCGNVNYNIFFEGIGTVYSERVCYSISLNC